MASKRAPSGDNKVPETAIHQRGMRVRTDPVPDKSMRCKGGSVDSDATRSEVGRAHSIGGREA
jgi:hypothetical protein